MSVNIDTPEFQRLLRRAADSGLAYRPVAELVAYCQAWHSAHPAQIAASWTAAARPPDADLTVMLATADGEVWQGYWDGGDYIDVSGLRLAPGRVTYWQHNPRHPEDLE